MSSISDRDSPTSIARSDAASDISLLIAALGVAAIVIGFDQRRRARKPPEVRPLRRFP